MELYPKQSSSSTEPPSATLSLCSPSADLTCFGCCPPIRPRHYDCLKYVGSLRREFAENRRLFLEQGPVRRPIVGYHCWALGFLDARGREVGCLLHPNRNGGRDLRSLIDYGDKCRRESCLPARVFNLLPPGGRHFWLPLARGLSPFYFSSPRSNPLFHVLLWGSEILEPLRLQAVAMGWTETEVLHHHRFLTDSAWAPQAHRYLFRLIMQIIGPSAGLDTPLDDPAGELRSRIRSLPQAQGPPQTASQSGFTHQLPLDNDFLDFVRLGLGWPRTALEEASSLKMEVEELARAVVLSLKMEVSRTKASNRSFS
jgi:hypothetical protein